MPQARVYQRKDGTRPFDAQFDTLEARAAARVITIVARLERGLRPDVEPVGDGAFEAKIDYGPGYRIYFALDGSELVILLLCGSKKRQNIDINDAKTYWSEYKQRKILPEEIRGTLLKPLKKEDNDAANS